MILPPLISRHINSFKGEYLKEATNLLPADTRLAIRAVESDVQEILVNSAAVKIEGAKEQGGDHASYQRIAER